MKQFRVGLVGAGYVSSYHIQALKRLKNIELVGIADLDFNRAAKTASQFEIRVFDSADHMYATHPDVVHVLTPPGSHCKVTLQALEKGCHVFIEKPMAATEDECELMIRK